MTHHRAIIIGAGPAGLTAAYELLQRTDITPIVIEKSTYMGGLARTVNYKGNRIDIGGHRFFSKSDRVMRWWLDRLPLQATDNAPHVIQYQGKSRNLISTTDNRPNPETTDRVMLLRERRSRIYYLRQLYDYPLRLSMDTLGKLGVLRTLKIGLSYFRSVVWPIRNQTNLEQFFINRFGRELYRTFFKSYTEKVWGVPCTKISAQWGAQRIKGLSITRILLHAIKKPFARRDIAQKQTDTSLIEQFLYPKYGPGQMWETVAAQVKTAGGQIITNQLVERIHVEGHRVTAIEAVDRGTGAAHVYEGDFFFSTMPIKELIRSMTPDAPKAVRQISDGLVYRDFITVGLLLKELKIKEDTDRGTRLIRDNWIYIQESDVRVGRMQIFNNWSPYMVADRTKVWIGLEYFCNESDELWNMSDRDMIALATQEMAKIGIIDAESVLDATVIKMLKTYPAYFGSYDRFSELQAWIDRFQNLFLIGRNGMHKYNNQDHAMLTAMVAVDNIVEGRTDKSNIWAVNTEQDYHEEARS